MSPFPPLSGARCEPQKLDFVPALCPHGLVLGVWRAPRESGYAETNILLTVFPIQPLLQR